ncbi:NADH dehydrogenase [ubiquinone] 1 beta subcomplex subunit 5, mitochondrial [Belonocnema kinseyi]|uniref:NADH dehydrogenase [ubiquinone] 1 beta subcomplex subunit 5, mitochondrial n=1 Tax=Belonocnema kinseyi TaxID=2817044 RepID=UPI00143DC4B3|nr:NADH dehydrogenase [ubiquinone] 1 beta subcomplex subunit 5, mitochondrial [Belonocnema kinseyi]XP_033218577.1 NADH dehydrogenase [ubiquinone] 1 beta subcomplex subunit 5, mitochondrial [Belonocnema kinseyi]
MAAWSNILCSTGEKVLRIGAILPKNYIQNGQIRSMGHGPRIFRIEPTRWQYTKFKDLLHFYIALGVIPLTIVTFITYVFVGPATLREIPEGYTPKYWEYYRNPITRFFMRTFNQSHQELYERTMHHMYEETQKAKIKGLERKVQSLIKKRRDYQEYYYIPYNAEKVYEMREFNQNYDVPLVEIDDATKQKIKAERAKKNQSS